MMPERSRRSDLTCRRSDDNAATSLGSLEKSLRDNGLLVEFLRPTGVAAAQSSRVLIGKSEVAASPRSCNLSSRCWSA
ncbi:MAG: hypothetical protein CM15mP84_06840 [Cellvibrionales bacterium]|nr:MAG: hypothetical protein CM15mP84_06840 [Cellvibrionales bacterium]